MDAPSMEQLDEDLEKFQQDDLVQAALSKGVDLRQYSGQIDRELKQIENESVKEYVGESDQVVQLHEQIQACDVVLARMQEMLLGFQADLGGISDEIRHLQDQSLSMNIKLRNRRAAQSKVQAFLENVELSEDLIKAILESDVNEVYLEYLLNLNTKLKYSNLKTPPDDQSSIGIVPAETAAVQDVKPQLGNLRRKAVAKIREFLVNNILQLKKPKTNVQMLQQNVLLKFSYLMQFLVEHAPEQAAEVRVLYVDTMGRTLHGLFRAYHANLQKLCEEVGTKQDLIVVEDNPSRAGLFSAKIDLTKRDQAFLLADRDVILKNADGPPIIYHVAQADRAKYPYEAIFRSIQKHLMDSATSEYLFTKDFFKVRSRDLFNQIFARTLSLCLENLENYLFSCYDAIGLLLMIRVTHAHRLIMERRRVPCLDAFFDRINLLLWPRFKTVFDLHMSSVQKAKVARLGTVDMSPHYVTNRYGEFSASILVLHQSPVGNSSVGTRSEGTADEMLLNSLAGLRKELVKLLSIMAATHGEAKAQMVFLINNYHKILNIFNDRRVDSDEISRFEDLLAEQREAFVEEELKQSYDKLIQFVKSTEAQGADARVDAALVEALVRNFAASWKNGIELINASVRRYFAEFHNGMEILKQVLTQLLLYYTRFQDIIRNNWTGQPPFSRDIITTATILQEIKKYSRTM